ncbi:DUF935 domain-containing protein [Denitratisoma sp. agr-D3]
MPQILDLNGNPIDRGALGEPQTAAIAQLQNTYLTPALNGLTPARLAAALEAADMGDLTSQARLFSDMEERNAHLCSEMGKRKLAVMGLDWDIVPPRNASAAEKSAAEWVKEVLIDATDPIEDLILALMDGVGHGFAPVEQEWTLEDGKLLPRWYPRPQEWFRLSTRRDELRLLDSSADGAPLKPFGWALHTHGKAKTGYLGRLGLYRVLSWPFIYAAYGIGDFAEFLEIYGLPIIVGKYFSTATPEEKASLRRAVTALGHDARAIMPKEMELEIQKITGGGDSTPHLAMVEWAERSMSKAILGQTLTSDTGKQGGGSYGLGKVHNEVREDIRNSDARQIATTINRDIIYPLMALNLGVAGLSRCPRLVFDTGEADDLVQLAEGVSKLVAAGMTSIPISWVHEKGRIPLPDGKEPTLGAVQSQAAPGGAKAATKAVMAALAAMSGKAPQPDELDDLASLMGNDWEQVVAPLVTPIERLAAECKTLEEFRARLPAAIEQMDVAELAALVAQGDFAAAVWGRINRE